ncbi:MAG: hypothetical protein QXU26_02695 [Thermofilaceae archaeon]
MRRPEEYLSQFLGDELREIGYYDDSGRFRRELARLDRFIESIFSVDVYYSVRSLVNVITGTWDRLFFDVDAHEVGLDAARESLSRLVGRLLLAGAEPICIFSGRGYHVYVLLGRPVALDVAAVRREVSAWGIGCLDTAVLNEAALARLPFTVNGRSGRLAIPVSCTTLAEDDSVVRNSPSVIANIFGEAAVSEPPDSRRVGRTPVEFGPDNTPLCVLRMLGHLAATCELGHFARFSLAIFMMRAFGREAALRAMSMACDYREHVTLYQLEHIASREYMYPSCERLEAEGFCNRHVRCPYRPWLERYLPGWGGGGNPYEERGG